MRVAAGIILIIAAIINIFAGVGWVIGGGATSLSGVAMDEAVKQAGTEAGASAEMLAKASEDVDTVKGAGAGLMIFGLFLWVLVVIQIIGAVFLFMSKSKKFIQVVAGLSIVGEVVGIVLTTFGWTNIFGLLGGILAFVAAASIATAVSSAPAPAPAPEA